MNLFEESPVSQAWILAVCLEKLVHELIFWKKSLIMHRSMETLVMSTKLVLFFVH